MQQEKDKPAKHVFSIPSGVSFLDTLASEIKSGRFTSSLYKDEDPLRLASVTVYLPTRRAVRKLQSIFSKSAGSKATIIPRIKVLGEFDEDDFLSEISEDDQARDFLSSKSVILSLDRLFLLTSLVQKWKQSVSKDLEERFQEKFFITTSLKEALSFAQDLIRLIDEANLKGADWNGLRNLDKNNFGDWEKNVFDFLRIVTDHWPKILQEREQVDSTAYSSALLRAQADCLKENPPDGLIIAAGSTGSLPATAEFLVKVAHLCNGVLVLPGLDKNLDDRTWNIISECDDESYVLTHPQCTLARLLLKVGVKREDVIEIGSPPQVLKDRSFLLSEILRPVTTTDKWYENRHSFGDEKITSAFEEISFIEAANEQEESAAIALALRYAIDCPEKTAALITPNRNLARRVSAQLKRFGILANDSGGYPLSTTSAGSLVQILVKSVLEPGDSVVLLSLLKHPLFRIGFKEEEIRNLVEKIELIALRGGFDFCDILSLSFLYRKRQQVLSEKKGFQKLLEYSNQHQDIIYSVLNKLETALAPLGKLRQSDALSIVEITEKTILCVEEICKDEYGKFSALYEGDAGEKLKEFLGKILKSTVDFNLVPKDWPSVLNFLMSAEVVRPKNNHPRIAIWGNLEARLQNVDTLILGGLNEDSWPRKPHADSLMSRTMRKHVNLDPPEWRIGLSAHDFEMAMGTSQVILSRSKRAGELPTLPSRWLQRLIAFIGTKATDELRERGNILLDWSRFQETPEKKICLERPAPCPPISIRPQHFSVSEIETLRRDPYAIYAKRVLRLLPLEPLMQNPEALERGMLFHEILYRFIDSGTNLESCDALEKLMFFAQTCFEEKKFPQETHAIWWKRFEKLAPKFLEFEQKREKKICKRYSEVKSQATEIGLSGVTLSAVADRIDILSSGRADILDYKTGSSPSMADAHKLFAPQLALEGALLLRGAFKEVGERTPEDILIIRLGSNGEVDDETILGSKNVKKSAVELAQEAWIRLEELIHHYNNPNTGYLSHSFPRKEKEMCGDYDHLARIQEWSAPMNE